MAVDEWRLDAACKGRWQLFDLASGSGKVAQVARGWCRPICAHCPVWRDCLLDALVTDDTGYRAGTTSNARNVRRTNRKARADRQQTAAVG